MLIVFQGGWRTTHAWRLRRFDGFFKKKLWEQDCVGSLAKPLFHFLGWCRQACPWTWHSYENWRRKSQRQPGLARDRGKQSSGFYCAEMLFKLIWVWKRCAERRPRKALVSPLHLKKYIFSWLVKENFYLGSHSLQHILSTEAVGIETVAQKSLVQYCSIDTQWTIFIFNNVLFNLIC